MDRGRDKAAGGSGAGEASLASPDSPPIAMDPETVLAEAIDDHRAGQVRAAAERYRAILRHQSNHVRARHYLALAMSALDDPSGALALIDETLTFAPNDPQIHNDKGKILLDLGRREEALAWFDRASALGPGFGYGDYNKGTVLKDAGRLEEALPCFDRAIRALPDYAAAHNNRGVVLNKLGRLSDAKAAFQLALALAPDFAEAFYNLSRLQSGADADTIGRMENLLTSGRLAPDQATMLHFALGKVFDDLGLYDRAFALFQAGNALDRRGTTFDATAHSAFVDRLISHFSQDRLASYSAIGNASTLPVFVIGMPRSGTTLVEQTLASHPAVYGAGELDYIGRIIAALPASMNTVIPYPECIGELDPVAANKLGEAYLAPIRLRCGDAMRTCDKMPSNFLHLGLIAALFPNARIIHCRRDPLDTCLSCYFQYFSHGLPHTRDLSDLGHYYRDYERLMAHWRRVLPLAMLEVDYQDMVTDHGGTTRRMLRFIDLPWDEACRDFHRTERSIRTASDWQVRQPIYRKALQRWRNYEPYLDPLRAALDGHHRNS